MNRSPAKRTSTDQQDTGAQVRVGGSEEEAAAGLQQCAGHLYVMVGKIRQQHLEEKETWTEIYNS